MVPKITNRQDRTISQNHIFNVVGEGLCALPLFKTQMSTNTLYTNRCILSIFYSLVLIYPLLYYL